MDKWEIFFKIIKAAATKEPNKCVVYLPGQVEFPKFIRVDSLKYDIKDEMVKEIKQLFNIPDNQIKDIDKDDFDGSKTSFKGQIKNSSTSEKTRLVIFDNYVEIGSYTGKFYDYYVLRKNDEQ
jgi:hypothetical protein